MSATAVGSALKLVKAGIRRKSTHGNGHANIARSSYTWERLPADLRELGSFVLFRIQNGRKVPFCPANPTTPASISDPKFGQRSSLRGRPLSAIPASTASTPSAPRILPL
jgi:hypothetical protein